jgi:hypothetical protein
MPPLNVDVIVDVDDVVVDVVVRVDGDGDGDVGGSQDIADIFSGS